MANDYPRPHEGVLGIDRPSDDPMVSEGAAKLIGQLCTALHQATLVGNPAPKVAKMRTRMESPVPGDRVAVRDTFWSSDPDRIHKGIGYLVASRKEREADDEAMEGFVDRAWYVQYGPNREDVCRWTNCSVIALPVEVSLEVPL